jgi:DNA-binding LytR/AlgR family response regulator
VVVDDEPLARMGLRKYISDHSNLFLLAECKNGVEALTVLKEKKIDVLFLDIEMPFKNGWEVIENLETRPLIVITTAYGQHALKGFEMNVADYLVKPFSKERFTITIERVKELLQLHALRDQEHILIKSDRTLHKLRLQDITQVQALENYVVFYTLDKKYIVHQTLASASLILEGQDFFRVHKSHIVNCKHIQSINANSLVVNGTMIPVGKIYRKQIEAITARLRG